MPSTGRWRQSTAVSPGTQKSQKFFDPPSHCALLSASSHQRSHRVFLSSQALSLPPSVSSEYQLAKPSDSHRKEMLFGSLAKPGHPMGKFCWGELVKTTAGTRNTHTTQSSLGYVQREQTGVLRQLPSLHFSPLIFLHFLNHFLHCAVAAAELIAHL